MSRLLLRFVFAGWLAGLCGSFTLAEETPAAGPALTRPEMKQRLEALKERTARILLPSLSDADRANGRSSVNNGRLRATYLPPSWQNFQIAGWGGSRQRPAAGNNAAAPTSSNPTNTLRTLEATPGYAYKTRLFWIVSRANDCQYCLGHQELKLRRVGMTDDQIAALDARWELFPASEQAGLAFAKKLTLSPHEIEPADIAKLQAYSSDSEVIDLVYTVARYNAVNRWTSSTGIPQDQSFGGEEHPAIDTPTSDDYANVTSQVAPVNLPARPAWESYNDVLTELAATRTRTPVVELPPVERARQVLAADTPGTTPPIWLQVLADQSVALDVWRQRQGRVRDGLTDPLLRTMIAWVSARENRAWYAAGHARARYVALGGAEPALASFEELLAATKTPAQAEALRFARKLTSAPHTIVDADIARLKPDFTDQEIAELIDLTSDANAFDRYTEALRLPLEF